MGSTPRLHNPHIDWITRSHRTQGPALGLAHSSVALAISGPWLALVAHVARRVAARLATYSAITSPLPAIMRI